MSNYRSTVLDKSVLILDRLSLSSSPMRFTDLLESTKLPKGTLHRLIGILSAERLVHFDESSGGYTLGTRVITWAFNSWSRLDIRQVAEPEMRLLSDLTKETVHLYIQDGLEVVCIDKIESQHQVRMHSEVGKRVPIYCTGSGKALAAFLPAEEQTELIRTLTLHKYTEQTIIDKTDLRRELREICELGYSYNQGEYEPDIHCIGAPILSHEGHSIGSMSVAVPLFRVDSDKMSEWATALMECTKRISLYYGARKTSSCAS